MSDVWTRWEGQVIDGTLPLVRCLGASDHSGVFLTEPRSGGPPKAALKLVPAIPSLVEAQLSHWRAAAALSHPRLIRLYDVGRCQLGEQHFLFVVMEYAEQNLAEVLPHRALTVDEAREMLLAALDPLAFLHGQQHVQGQLKPSNILVVGDQLKLASDTIRPAGEATASIGVPSLYDAPEGEREIFSTASDIWALGVTLAEAFIQRPPSWQDSRRASVELGPDFPATFADVVQRCLSPDPKARPSVPELLSWASVPGSKLPERAAAPAQPAASGRSAVAAQPATSADRPAAPVLPMIAERGASTRRAMPAPSVFHEPDPRPERRSYVALIVGVVALAIAGWAAVHVFSTHSQSTVGADPASSAAVANNTQTSGGARQDEERDQTSGSAAAPPVPARAETRPEASKRASGGKAGSGQSSASVLHEEIPRVPRSARDTIHGHIKVTVRVTVDGSGTVVGEDLDDPGPSRYFARQATQAARKWKFAPSEERASREWLVHFEFSRDGTTGHAAAPRSR